MNVMSIDNDNLTRRVLVIGGGGFMMEDKFTAIDRELIALTGKARPRVCIVPTPAGDAQELLDRFYAAYDPWCDACQLTPFRKPTARSVSLRDVGAELLTFDALFVSGGNTKSALGVWREWNIDLALRGAYQSGVLLSGMSAGAICWFEVGFTDSFGDEYVPLPGLGLLAGGCSPHHQDGTARSSELLSAIERGEMPATLTIDDHAAVLFEDEKPAVSYSWKKGAAARVVGRREPSRTVMTWNLPVPVRQLRRLASRHCRR